MFYFIVVFLIAALFTTIVYQDYEPKRIPLPEDLWSQFVVIIFVMIVIVLLVIAYT